MKSDLLVPAVVAFVIVVSLLIFRTIRIFQSAKRRNTELSERQKAIQSAIDAFGLVLDDRTTTVQDGENALLATIAELHGLGVHKDLPELISDTESFFKQWRASSSNDKGTEEISV